MKKYFLKHPLDNGTRVVTDSQVVDSGLCNKSIFNLQISNNHHIKVFKNVVLKDLNKTKLNKNINPYYITEG